MLDLAYAFGIFAGYVILYRLNDALIGSTHFGGVASLIFLPAFVRLLGFLLIGPWTIFPLFFAALICVDLGLGIGQQVIVAMALSCGAPIALAFACKMTELNPTLSNLTVGRMFVLSLASAVGSSAAYNISLIIVGNENASPSTTLAALAGDTLGTWAVIYTLKLILTAVGRLLPKRR